MKFINLEPKELEYCSTLDWNSLMTYLEKKYGVAYKNEFKKRLEKAFEKEMARKEKEKEQLK